MQNPLDTTRRSHFLRMSYFCTCAVSKVEQVEEVQAQGTSSRDQTSLFSGYDSPVLIGRDVQSAVSD